MNKKKTLPKAKATKPPKVFISETMSGGQLAAMGPKTPLITSLYGGAGFDTVIAGNANQYISFAGDSIGGNLISVPSSKLLATDTIIGGGGGNSDILQITGAGKYGPGTFSKVSGVEELSLSGASSVTLASGSSFSTVIGGSAPGTLNASGSTTPVTIDSSKVLKGGDTLIGSTQAPTTFILSNAAELKASVINATA
ncbi:MAG: hypothetical protein DVB30_06415, partial [Verrucomicrobia bacterium]